MHSFQVADVKVFCREINFLRTNEDLGEQTYKVIWSRKLVSLLRNFLSKYCRDEIKSRGPLWRRKISHRRRTKGLFWIFIMRYFSAEKLNWYNLETAKNENGSSFRAQSSYFSIAFTLNSVNEDEKIEKNPLVLRARQLFSVDGSFRNDKNRLKNQKRIYAETNKNERVSN